MKLDIARVPISSYNESIESKELKMSQTWEEMSNKEQLECIFWDAYKDAYGIRPRHVDFKSMSEEDLCKQIDHLEVVIKQNSEQRKEAEKRAISEFEALVNRTIETGAKNRETALRWIMEGSECGGDWDYLCYMNGLPFGYFKIAA